MPRRSVPVALSETELYSLDQWIRAGSTPQQVVLRAKIIRSVAEGQSDKSVSAALAVRRETVALWRSRVREQGIGCVWEIASGRGRKPSYDAAQVGRWIKAALQTKPAGWTHWSTRSIARAEGVSKNTIQRAWQDHGLKPHLTKTFMLPHDPLLLEKLSDVVGVYLTPARTPWSFASTRRARFVHWAAPSPACHSSPAGAAPIPMTTTAMAPPPCSLPCRSPRAGSSVSAIPATAIRNSSSSYGDSTRSSRSAKPSI